MKTASLILLVLSSTFAGLANPVAGQIGAPPELRAILSRLESSDPTRVSSTVFLFEEAERESSYSPGQVRGALGEVIRVLGETDNHVVYASAMAILMSHQNLLTPGDFGDLLIRQSNRTSNKLAILDALSELEDRTKAAGAIRVALRGESLGDLVATMSVETAYWLGPAGISVLRALHDGNEIKNPKARELVARMAARGFPVGGGR